MNKRKQIYSETLDPVLVEKVIELSPEDNFSKIVTIALEDYLKKIELLINKWYTKREINDGKTDRIYIQDMEQVCYNH